MESLIAAALLAGPPIPPFGLPDITPVLIVELKREAERLELMDASEWKYYLSYYDATKGMVWREKDVVTPGEFHDHLKRLWDRREELKDAPNLSSLWRFPAQDDVLDTRDFVRKFKQNLEEQAEWDSAFRHSLQEEIGQARSSYRLWDTLYDARCSHYNIRTRRKAALRLKQELGDEAFYNGQMPPHVPWWNFREIR